MFGQSLISVTLWLFWGVYFGMKNAPAPDADELTMEERRDALADVFAEGFLCLVDNGLLAEVMGEGEAGDDHGGE